MNENQMRREGLSEQEIAELVESDRFFRTEILPAFLGLPEAGDTDELHQMSASEWFFHRDLCAELSPARRSVTDADTGDLARLVVINATPEAWQAIWRKHTYGK